MVEPEDFDDTRFRHRGSCNQSFLRTPMWDISQSVVRRPNLTRQAQTIPMGLRADRRRTLALDKAEHLSKRNWRHR